MIALEDHFKFEATDLRKILELALSRGGDFAEIYSEYRLFNFINMEEDIIKETAETISLGLGIRVICGDKTGYGYTNDLSLDEIRRAALTAAAIASGKGARSIPRFQRVRIKRTLYPVKEAFQGTGLSQKIELVKKAYLACQKSSQKIKKVKVTLQDHVRQVFIVNSAGLVARDARPQVRLICTAIAEKAKRREIGFSGGGGRVGFEYFRDVLTPEHIGKEAAEEALTLLQAVEAPAGEMPVVLAPGHSGVLVHEAVGHLLEADFNRKKTSIFWNKLGKKVGSGLVTITDDPTIPSFRGSYAVDDEGTVPRKTLLIEKGRVVSFLQDRLSAQLMRRPLTGHGRLYLHSPSPDVQHLYRKR
jgi:TldD protein